MRAALRHPLVVVLHRLRAPGPRTASSRRRSSHPRAWGSAARILGHYVRDEKLLTLEEAIRKMTSLPASRMRLADRGIVRPGMAADLVVFDPATVASARPTPTRCHYSEGIPYVAVNGQLVVDGGPDHRRRGPGARSCGPGYRGR